ncbi:hypothetical protein LSAT2_011913, partial [Lamellibrachia satsuma]
VAESAKKKFGYTNNFHRHDDMSRFIVISLLLVVIVTSCHGDDDDDAVAACEQLCNKNYSGACASRCVALYGKSTFECNTECRTSKEKCIRLCKPVTREWW